MNPLLEKKDLFDAIGSLLSRGEKSDTHYTWNFWGDVKSNKISTKEVLKAIDELNNDDVACLVKKWLVVCVEDYEYHELKKDE